VLSKERRGLTRTLIGKAIELRQSIPWANPSAVLLLADPKRPGKMRVRPSARNVLIAFLLAIIAGGAAYIWRHPTEQVDVYEVVIAPPVTKPLDPPQTEAAPIAEEKPAPAPESTKPAAVVTETSAPPPAKAPESPSVPKPASPSKPASAQKPVPTAPAPKTAAAPAAPKAAPPPPPVVPAGKLPPGTLVVLAMCKGKPVKDAAVHIDGVSLGNTPVKAAVLPGKYTVKVEHAGFKIEKRPDIEVRPGKTQTVTVELKK
jgi:hypothetical protein